MACDVPGHEGVGKILAYHADTDLSKVPALGTRVGIPLIRSPCGVCAVCELVDGEVKPDVVIHQPEDIVKIYQRMEQNQVIGRAVLDFGPR